MIRKVRGECKCLKQMAGGARGLISASHLTSSDDLGAHMFTTTLSFFVSTDTFTTIFMNFTCPSILTDKEGYLRGFAVIHGTLVLTNG